MSINAIDPNATRALALSIRKHALSMIRAAGSSHLGSSLSMADILAVLYGGIMGVSPENVASPHLDRVVFSKGHRAARVYPLLRHCGGVPRGGLGNLFPKR